MKNSDLLLIGGGFALAYYLSKSDSSGGIPPIGTSPLIQATNANIAAALGSQEQLFYQAEVNYLMPLRFTPEWQGTNVFTPYIGLPFSSITTTITPIIENLTDTFQNFIKSLIPKLW